MNVLFVSSEVFPLVKTGGLADVSGSLPFALAQTGVNVRVLLPGYRDVLSKLPRLHKVASLEHMPVVHHVDILMGELTQAHTKTKLKVLVVHAPSLYDREGGVYLDTHGYDWSDNAVRFAVLSKVAALLSGPHSPLHDWRVDLVHCNDWQTGLTPVYMKFTEHSYAKSLMSLHNMAYQGCFAKEWLPRLQLPASCYSVYGLEYHHQISFLKAGIQYADGLSTVSPTYAKEIQTSAFGFGLEGLLAKRGNEIVGILNGIDTAEWNPRDDPYLAYHYSAARLANKARIKAELQKMLGLSIDARTPILGVVSRLTYQKGLDMLLPILPEILVTGAQFVMLGSGEVELQEQYLSLARQYSEKCHISIAYDEAHAHHIMAGADIFIMPSRFEPCGLNQLYGLIYGTPPIVNATGGLADSVVDTTDDTLKAGTATGFVMEAAHTPALRSTIQRALDIYHRQAKVWRAIQRNGMRQEVSWGKSAQAYLKLYQHLVTYVGKASA